MLTGVEILLERMKTNPEEFIEGGYSKWSRVINGGWDIFTAEEQKALQDGVNNAKREHFNGEVMRVLAGHVDGMSINEPLTISKITQESLNILNNEFDKAYAKTKTPRAPKA
jgi:hypothetical protein